VWGCVTKVMLFEPKKRKIGSKISNCAFIAYSEYSVAYCFLDLKSDGLDCNIIVETRILNSLNTFSNFLTKVGWYMLIESSKVEK
jgi:hypothetical protein